MQKQRIKSLCDNIIGCETQKAIAASETAILSRIDAFENQNLRDKVQELQDAIARPAYVTYAPGQSVFPPYPAVAAANVYGANGCGGCGNF